jgi:cytochrome c-type biogenesis protein
LDNISLVAAFGAGLASFISPCVIPLVPVYFASLCGPEILDPHTSPPRKTIFLHSLFFVLGFSLIFIALGVLVGLTDIIINPNSVVVRSIVGGLLIFFGLFMLLSTRIPWLNYEKRLSPSLGTTSGYLRSFLTGCLFSLAWTPCISPLLGGILALAWGGQTAWQGGYLLAVYSLGLGLPFLLIGAAFSWLKPVLKRIQRYSRVIYIVSGILLVVIGVFILINKLTWLSGALS